MNTEKHPAPDRPIDAFAWAYAFFAHLVNRRAPATHAHISDLAQMMYVIRGHRDPKQAAEEVLAEWPFELSS